jgi:apolipoprotein N-acyltransferase
MITNDGWWKNTPGYQHHFNFSPVRAIENRRDFVRVANTGISAIIDARGMVMARTPWWKKTTLKGKVHLRRGQTFFARHGDYLGRISLVCGAVLVLYGIIRKRKKGGAGHTKLLIISKKREALSQGGPRMQKSYRKGLSGNRRYHSCKL